MTLDGPNGGTEWSRRQALGFALLGGAAVLLAAAWLWTLSGARAVEKRCRTEEAKVKKVKAYVEKNYEKILGPRDAVEAESPLLKKPLLSIVKDVTAQCGVADRLQRVVEEENKKANEVTAKVTLRRVRMADVVNLLSIAKKEYPGLWDREARMRYARGQEADRWDVTLSLTAVKP
jgi:hypothetical protein